MITDEARQKLLDCIQKRPRPEDVAELILEVNPNGYKPGQKAILQRAANHSFRRGLWAYSSMAADFWRPPGAEKQVNLAATLFGVKPLSAFDCLEPEKVEEFIKLVSPKIGKAFGQSDFKKDRLNRSQRIEARIESKGRRSYNKRFRLLRRMENKLQRMIVNAKKYKMSRIAKSSFGFRIGWDDLNDLNTACFAAYMSSRMSMRSVFTCGSQDRAFDQVADTLLKVCEKNLTTNWLTIAQLMPDDRVIRHLNDEQKGQLVGMTFETMKEVGEFLADLATQPGLDLENLIVHRGNDSSSWNAAAGAWNKAREHWISLLYSLKMEEMLDHMCPGKCLRLMAADVVRWHSMSKGSEALHPDTKVWRELPAPWDVLSGKYRCTRNNIIDVCSKYKVKIGTWTGPKGEREPVEFKPTPELVHGVAVSSPSFALAMRKAGYFSAKSLKGYVPGVMIERDEFGFATGARTADENGEAEEAREDLPLDRRV